MVMVWVHSKPYFMLYQPSLHYTGRAVSYPCPQKTTPCEIKQCRSQQGCPSMIWILFEPSQIRLAKFIKELIFMHRIHCFHERIELYYYGSGFQDLLLVKVTSLKHVWHKIHFCTFFHTEDWKHSVRLLEDFSSLNSNACLADETHYTDRCELLRWGRHGHMQMSLIWTGAKFLNGAVAALGENASI